MKIHTRIYLFSLLSLIIVFCSCNKHPDEPCNDPVLNYFTNNSNLWIFGQTKIGDTLTFNVYHKDKPNGGKYLFIKNSSFIASDSGTKVEYILSNNFTSNCNDHYLNHNKVMNFKGTEPLQYALEAGPGSIFDINFHKKVFSVGSDQYYNKSSGWYDSLTIWNKKFFQVEFMKGYIQGDHTVGSYIDSTYCFYNLTFGPLKFIVNDTTIYVRQIK